MYIARLGQNEHPHQRPGGSLHVRFRVPRHRVGRGQHRVLGGRGPARRRDRVAEVVKLDMTVEEGKVARFRTRLALSFKYEPND
jgi:hypothetical protein